MTKQERGEENRMNNIERARKYSSIEWNEEQIAILSVIFERLDYLLLTCQKEDNQQKIDAITDAHRSLHDVVLAMALNKILEE